MSIYTRLEEVAERLEARPDKLTYSAIMLILKTSIDSNAPLSR